MKHLIVYAHPAMDGFNRAVLDTVTRTLESRGHSVRVHDLYRRGFSPVLTTDDLQSFRTGKVWPDIAAEQDALANADALVLIFPIWWTAAPAILKGWFDRVLSWGFAYSTEADGSPKPLLKGKLGAVVASHGTPEAVYEASGMSASMDQILSDGVFRFTGIEPVLHHLVGSVNGGESRAALQKRLNDVGNAIARAF